ncbi:MAG: hypothetical protein SFV15_16440 [Polyangiaceae bacterium]|nr:hypothetical protein [Polyangiaceae bacterium]
MLAGCEPRVEELLPPTAKFPFRETAVLWLDAREPGLTPGLLPRWADLSPTGVDAVQLVPALQPSLLSTPWVRFGLSSEMSTGARKSSSASFGLIAVFMPGGGKCRVLQGAVPGSAPKLVMASETDALIIEASRTKFVLAGKVAVQDTPTLVAIRQEAFELEVRVNAQAVERRSVTETLGDLEYISFGGMSECSLGAVILFDTDLSDAQLSVLEPTLMEAWGIPEGLPR